MISRAYFGSSLRFHVPWAKHCVHENPWEVTTGGQGYGKTQGKALLCEERIKQQSCSGGFPSLITPRCAVNPHPPTPEGPTGDPGAHLALLTPGIWSTVAGLPLHSWWLQILQSTAQSCCCSCLGCGAPSVPDTDIPTALPQTHAGSDTWGTSERAKGTRGWGDKCGGQPGECPGRAAGTGGAHRGGHRYHGPKTVWI